jgi:spermidine/putrescine transport system permease protein
MNFFYQKIKYALAVHTFLVFGFLYLPIGLLLLYSFNSNPVEMLVWEGFTTHWIEQIFAGVALNEQETVNQDPQMLKALTNSLIVAIWTTVLSTIFGTIAALALRNSRLFGQTLYRALIYLPLLLPDLVIGIGLLAFFIGIGAKLGLMTIIVAQCTFLISYVCITISAQLAHIDHRLEEASADLGSGPWRTFYRVTLPQITPSMVAAALLTFVISLDNLVISYFVAGVGSTTLPIYILGLLRRGISPQVGAFCALILLGSLILAAIALSLQRKGKRQKPTT